MDLTKAQQELLVWIGTGPGQERSDEELSARSYLPRDLFHLVGLGLVRILDPDTSCTRVETTEAGHNLVGELGGFADTLGPPALRLEHCGLDGGDLMTVEEYREGVKSGRLTDYDGSGTPVWATWSTTERRWQVVVDDTEDVSPPDMPPEGATYLVWYNR
jgi:hypothetical protein